MSVSRPNTMAPPVISKQQVFELFQQLQQFVKEPLTHYLHRKKKYAAEADHISTGVEQLPIIDTHLPPKVIKQHQYHNYELAKYFLAKNVSHAVDDWLTRSQESANIQSINETLNYDQVEAEIEKLIRLLQIEQQNLLTLAQVHQQNRSSALFGYFSRFGKELNKPLSEHISAEKKLIVYENFHALDYSYPLKVYKVVLPKSELAKMQNAIKTHPQGDPHFKNDIGALTGLSAIGLAYLPFITLGPAGILAGVGTATITSVGCILKGLYNASQYGLLSQHNIDGRYIRSLEESTANETDIPLLTDEKVIFILSHKTLDELQAQGTSIKNFSMNNNASGLYFCTNRNDALLAAEMRSEPRWYHPLVGTSVQAWSKCELREFDKILFRETSIHYNLNEIVVPTISISKTITAASCKFMLEPSAPNLSAAYPTLPFTAGTLDKYELSKEIKLKQHEKVYPTILTAETQYTDLDRQKVLTFIRPKSVNTEKPDLAQSSSPVTLANNTDKSTEKKIDKTESNAHTQSTAGFNPHRLYQQLKQRSAAVKPDFTDKMTLTR